mmetsp:Transcript_19094/g.37503  ORF Transcript_19094/g.37503 Transcript_19094/m.37503 type:complete len:837 (+) Transcript_19094:80-2590(+)
MGRKQTKKLIQKFAKKQKASGNTDVVASGLKSKSLTKTSKAARALDNSRKKSGNPSVQSLIAKEFKKRKRSPSENGAKAKGPAAETKQRKLFDEKTGKAIKNEDDEEVEDDLDQNKNAINGSMSIEDFLAGGFKGDAEDSDSEDEGEAAEDQDEDESEDEEEDQEEDESEDEETHKAELEALKEQDPEFYKYLQEEDAGLLTFGQEEESGDEEGESEEEDAKPVEKKDGKTSNGKTLVTFNFLRSLDKDLQKSKPTRATLKTMITLFAFVAAEKSTPEGDEKPKSSEYKITNELVKERIIRIAMSRLADAIDNHIELQRPKVEGRRKIVKSHAKWGKVEKLVYKFLAAVVQLLNTANSEDMQIFMYRRLPAFGIYIATFPGKVVRKFVKTLIAKWGASRTSDRVRLLAFASLRRLSTETTAKMLPEILKPTYLEFVRGSKHNSAQEATRIAMQAKCLVDLFGIDLSVTYQLAFVYIRQLALHLRAAVISKTTESTRGVYGWQFIHCLRLWGVVLSSYPGTPKADEKGAKTTPEDHQLRSLIYPLIQIIVGTIRLSPASRNFPVRFHCAAVLINLGRSSRHFIPVGPILLDVFACAELRERAPQATMAKEPNLDEVLYLNKNALASAPAQHALVRRAVEIIERYLDCYRFSIGFPEIAFPILAALRAFRRKSKLPRARDDIKGAISKIEAWVETVKQKREKSTFAPSNVERINAFMSVEEDEARAQANITENQTIEEPAESSGAEASEASEGAEDESEEEGDSEGEDAVMEEGDSEDEGDEDDSEEEEEEEEEKVTKTKKGKQTTQKPSATKNKKKVLKLVDEDDLVEDMEMSSDEE